MTNKEYLKKYGNVNKHMDSIVRKGVYRGTHEGREKKPGKLKKLWRSVKGLFGYSSKRDKTGGPQDMIRPVRYRDTISKLDDNSPEDLDTAFYDPEAGALEASPFFDPFKKMGVDQNGISRQMQQDFRKRVEDQILLAAQEDGGIDVRDRAIEDAVAAIYENREEVEKYSTVEEEVNDLIDRYDYERGFKADVDKAGDPDNYELNISVGVATGTEDMPELYDVLSKDKFMDLFHRGEGVAKKNKNDLVTDAMKKTESYKRLVQQGKAEASAVGLEYDETLDPNIFLLKRRIDGINLRETGHSSLKMKALEGSSVIKQYSFGFVQDEFAKGVAEGRHVTGVIQNPDSGGGDTISRDYSITQRKYVEAAARIRGLIGSARTYRYTGYNCATFVADIARTAGISLDENQIMSNVADKTNRNIRVETPYGIYRMLKAEKKKDEEGREHIDDSFGDMLIEGKTDFISAAGRADDIVRLLATFKRELGTVKDGDEFNGVHVEALEFGGVGGMTKAYLEKLSSLKAFKEAFPVASEKTVKGVFSALVDMADDKYRSIVNKRDTSIFLESVTTIKERRNSLINRHNRLVQALGTDSVLKFLRNSCMTDKGFNFAMDGLKEYLVKYIA